jgi:hypothetical protein
MLSILAATLLVILCWGTYGPVLQQGNVHMEGSGLRPFILVGLAYFLIAVVTPIVLLQLFGEPGHWSTKGILWSFIAGAVGAIGALGVILAFKFRGSPVYVMPLVFGGAPVVNTALAMWLSKTYKQIGPLFLAGLIMVVAGAVTVLVFRPQIHRAAPAVSQAEASAEDATATAADTSAPRASGWLKVENFALVFLCTALTALAWGAYGPTLHLGQSAMAGSRLRPFLCVGVAYFLIAVLVPSIWLAAWGEPGSFTVKGSFWSLAGGAVGAIGALGVILAFNFGGRPIYIMPLVFGGAPIVNTLISVAQHHAFGQIGSMFYAGVIVVIAGAVTVLVSAPRPGKHGADDADRDPAPNAAPA